MKIYGLRIYRNNLLGNFRPAAAAWRDHTFANEFPLCINSAGELEDPWPALRNRYGSALVDADAKRGLALLRGDDFCAWAASLRFNEGALLPIFREVPSFELLDRLYLRRSRKFRLTHSTWPAGMRALLQMWDGVYWQIFTTEQSDVDILIHAHAGDPKLLMYYVDLEREYPDPSNQELQIAVPSRAPGTGRASASALRVPGRRRESPQMNTDGHRSSNKPPSA